MDRVKKTKFLFPDRNRHGFTLIELMIALVLSIIVIIGIYNTFISQHKSYIIQERAAEMQQTIRSAISRMESDIRMAGYDPDQTGGYGITTAAANNLVFTRDDGTGSAITMNFGLYDSNDSDSEANELRRRSGAPAAAFHVDDLQFAYAYDADGDGDIDQQGGRIIWAVPVGGSWFNLDDNNDGKIDINDTAGGADTGTSVNFSDIRAVRVWLLVRSSRTDSTYRNPDTYVVGANHYTPADNYRRKLVKTTIKLRNAGL